MSEPPSSPYQSKFFNFLNRQTIKVKEQVERTFRQAKVAVTWGVQVVMYPIYLIFQSTRYASYRFQQSAQQTWKRLQPSPEPEPYPEVDVPIQQVLATIETFELNPAFLESILAVNAPLALDRPPSAITIAEPQLTQISDPQVETQSLATIGGKLGHLGRISVASQLETRQLVLVASSNQVLDVLTPEQQKLLMRRIVWEIAIYKHNWRLQALSNRGFPLKIVPARRSQVLPPIRWFWQAMAWLQTSEVAIAIDLFQESSLITAINSEILPDVVLPPQIAQIIKELEIPGMAVVERQLSSLDVAIAKAETYLLSGSNPPNLTADRTASELQIAAKSSAIPVQVTPSQQQIHRSQTDPFNLQKLLWAAIDYFFGTQNAKGRDLASSSANSSNTLPQTSSLSLPDRLNSWLDWNDLFPEPPAVNPPLPPPKISRLPPPRSSPRPKLAGKNPQTPKLSPRAEVPSRSVWSTVKSWLGGDRADRLPQNLARASSDPIESGDSDRDLKARSRKLGEAIVSSSNSPSLEYTPNWIETDATSKGYVKHPLRKLLDGLDRIMLAIESLFEKIYIKLRKMFGK